MAPVLSKSTTARLSGNSDRPLRPRRIVHHRESAAQPSRTFEKVERAKQEWEATADSLTELICLLDEDGRVRRANRVVEAWELGSVVHVRGQFFHDVVHPECRDEHCYLLNCLREAQQKADQGGTYEHEAYDAVLKRHLLLKLKPVASPNRLQPSNSIVILEDISARKAAAAALQRHTDRLAAMNEIKQAILAARSPEEIAQAALGRVRRLIPVDQARVMLYDAENMQFYLLAASPDTHPDHTLPDGILAVDDPRRPDSLILVADLRRLDNPSEAEQRLLAEGFRAFFSFPLVAEQEFIGSFSLAAAAPGDLAAEDRGLAREVADLLAIAIRQAQLYQQLQQANVDLQAALEAKDEMIRNVSHELRTPLVVIQGYLELLQEGTLGAVTAEQQNALSILANHSERLSHMVSLLLALKMAETHTLHRQATDLVGLLRDAMTAWEIPATKAGVDFDLDVPADLPAVFADPMLLAQVVYNLLDNAIKFSPVGGLVTLSAQRDGTSVLISVRDHGIGIPADKLGRVFERFYQVNGGLNRFYGGMGIGLSICQAIVQAHGGRIWATSSGEGQGSVFTISVPLAAPDAAVQQTTATDEPALAASGSQHLSPEASHYLRLAPLHRFTGVSKPALEGNRSSGFTQSPLPSYRARRQGETRIAARTAAYASH